MRLNLRFRSLCTVVVAAALTGGVVAPAGAAETAPDLVAIISQSAPEVLENVAAAESVDTGAPGSVATFVEVPEHQASVAVPNDPQDPITLVSGDKHALSVTLPKASEASDAKLLADGVVSYDNGDGSDTVPVVKNDGSVQITTVIEGPQAPTRYAYELSTQDGVKLTVVETGAVLITDQSGGFVGAVAPAWEKDANGEPVPTRYEVDGSSLVQVVDFGPETAFPVVADPWLGIQLFTGFSRTTYNGDYRYNGRVTALGAVILSGGGGVGGYLAGQAVFRAQGWDEWKAKWPAITNKATLRSQYECHVAASTYGLPFTGEYNLERSRANRSNWAAGVATHRCNW